ncbi:MAG TPA: lysophospholipid acyltransferase family protein [Vampirovibrionales bacterium]
MQNKKQNMNPKQVEQQKQPAKNKPNLKSKALLQKLIVTFLIWPFYNIFFRFKVSGKSNIPQKGPFIIVSNHFSYFDPTILALAVRHPIAYIAKKELFEIHGKLFSNLIRLLGTIPINRTKPGPEFMRQLKNAFNEGWAAGVFIEGTRNKERQPLKKLESGAAFISRVFKNVPVLPIGIKGSDKWFSEIEVSIGEVIDFDKEISLEENTLKYGKAIAELSGLGIDLATN